MRQIKSFQSKTGTGFNLDLVLETMQGLLQEAEVLRSNGQPKDLILLVEMLWPQLIGSESLEINPLTDHQNAQVQYQLVVYFADALQATKDYRRAKRFYENALHMRKNLTRLQAVGKKRSNASSNNIASPPTDMATEIQLKMSIARCQEKMDDYDDAICTLESIPRKQRSTKANLSLARLYRRDNVQRGSSLAKQCYRDILAVSPLSLDTIKQLIKLGEKSSDILTLIQPAIDRNPALICWIPDWIEANCHLYSTKTEKAIPLFEQLIASSSCPASSSLVSTLRISLAEAFYFTGCYKKVISILKESVIDKFGIISPAVDMIAASLFQLNACSELEALASQITRNCHSHERSASVWIALAYFCFSQNKRDSKALYFVQQSSFCSSGSNSGSSTSTHIEALLLKGAIMAAGRNFSEAIHYLIEAFNEAPYRFDTHKYLADVYVQDGRKQLAQQIACNAFSRFGKTPATLTLSSSILLSASTAPSGQESSSTGTTGSMPSAVVNQQQRKQAKSQLEQAVSQDPAYIPAVILLSNIYNDEKQNDRNLKLLITAVQLEPSNTKLHRMLGELYIVLNDQDKALHHHNIATKIEMNLRSSIGSVEPSQRLSSSQHQLDSSAMLMGGGGSSGQANESGAAHSGGSHAMDGMGGGIRGGTGGGLHGTLGLGSVTVGALDLDEGADEDSDSDDEILEESGPDTTAEEGDGLQDSDMAPAVPLLSPPPQTGTASADTPGSGLITPVGNTARVELLDETSESEMIVNQSDVDFL